MSGVAEAVPSSVNDKVMSGVGRWVPVVLGAILVWPAIPLLELAVGSAILVRPALLMTPMRSLAAVVQVDRWPVDRWVPVVLGAILVWPAIPLLELAVGSAILVRPALLMTPMRSLAAVVQVVRWPVVRWPVDRWIPGRVHRRWT